MNSADPDPAEVLHRVRQQLILAQVRIMELEDARDETESRLTNSNLLLRSAQTLADQKLDEAGHLEKAQAELQFQFEHLRHVQHVTHQALESARSQLADSDQSLVSEKQLKSALGEQLRQLQETQQKLEHQLAKTNVNLMAQQQRAGKLELDVRTLKSSRSWRWTSWLRSLERISGGKKP